MLNKKVLSFVKKLITSKKFILILLMILVSSAIYNFFCVSARVKGMKQKLNNLEAEAENLNREVKVLDKKLKHVNSEEFIKEVARKELGLVKPGETLYIIVDENNGRQKNEAKKN